MSLVFYVGDAGPIPAVVTDVDGTTPVTPISATATIVNLHTGATVISDAACDVEEGLASYIIPTGSVVTDNAGRYAAYIRVVIDATTIQTVSVPFDVLDKSSYLAVDRWRRKVEFSAPNRDSLSDQEGRDWIDQAVAYLRREFELGYTSTLGQITPDTGVSSPTASDIELIADVAALMSRTAWWAGKGSWRDEELSFDASPFQVEWAALRNEINSKTTSGWFDAPSISEQWNMRNRDNINRLGNPQDRDYYYPEDRDWWYSDQV